MYSPQKPPTTHTVKSGDTLSKLAAQFDCTVADLVEWNDIENPDLIRVGQELTVSAPNGDFVYTVVAGDTVSGLAERFGRSWLDIAAVNKLDDMNLILVGQKLIIPGQSLTR